MDSSDTVGVEEGERSHDGIHDTVVAVPREYFCPISKQVLHTPVLAEDGYTYEQELLVQNFANDVNEEEIEGDYSEENAAKVHSYSTGEKMGTIIHIRTELQEEINVFLSQHPQHRVLQFTPKTEAVKDAEKVRKEYLESVDDQDYIDNQVSYFHVLFFITLLL